MEEDFPVTPPVVRCLTPIYHPNIDPTDDSEDSTNVCLDMFDSDIWDEVYGLDGALQGILFLFYHPNIEDPLSPYFDPSIGEDEFENNVRSSLRGENVDGIQFKCNMNDEGKVELIMDMLTKDDSAVEVTKAAAVGERNYEVIVKTGADNEILTPDTNDTVITDVNATVITDVMHSVEVKDNVMLEVKDNVMLEISDSAITEIGDTVTSNNRPTIAQGLFNVEQSVIDILELPVLHDNDVKGNLMSHPTRVQQHGRPNNRVKLQTFDRLSPETDVLLFLFSQIFSKALVDNYKTRFSIFSV